jgi:hypothetical protein
VGFFNLQPKPTGTFRNAIVPRALLRGFRNFYLSGEFECRNPTRRDKMGRSILLWLLGVPIPIIILLALFWH